MLKLCRPLIHFATLLGLTTSVCGQVALKPSAASSADHLTELKPGVVVEEVAKYSEAEKAGLKQGDVILHWARGETTGEIQSPFDLFYTETEQEPRGPVTLAGLSNGKKQVWTLGPSGWGTKVRPQLATTLLAAYREGQELAKAGKPAEAAERWRSLAGQASSSSFGWLSAWLLYRSAEMLADARQWKETDSAYQEAVEKAAGTGPGISASLLRAWARTCDQRSDWANAEKYYQQSIAESQKLDRESLMVAMSLDDLGEMTRKQGNLAKAEEYHRQSLDIKQKLAPGSLAVAASINNLGIVARLRGDPAKADEYYRQALDIRQKVAPGSLAVATSFNGLGNVAADRGDLAKAEEYHRQALAIRQTLAPGSLDVAASFNNLGNIAQDRGDLAKAEEYQHQALDIRQKFAPGSLDVAGSFNNLGNVAQDRGDLAKAEEYHRQALDIKQKLAPGSLDVADSFNNLGLVAADRGDLAKAEKYYRRALDIQTKLAPGSLDVADSLNNLGNVSWYRGDLAKAEEYYHQALDIQTKLAPGSLDVADSFMNLGLVACERGDLAKAEEYHRQALDIKQKLVPGSLSMATALQAWGDLSLKRDNLENAEEYYHQALVIRERLAPGSKAHAELLASLASIMRRKQQPGAAAQFFDKALDALENQTAHLGGGEEARSSFRAKHTGYYKDYVDLLISQKQPERALEVLERWRSRTLLEMLAAAHVDVHKGVDPALLEREHSLSSDLQAKSNRRIRLLSGQHTNEQVAAMDREIQDLLTQHKDLEEQIRVNSPGYAALTQPKTLNTKEIQLLLDEDTLLLEYALGEERSYVFAVTTNSLNVYELPKRAEIESSVRRLHERLTTWENRGSRGSSHAAGLTRETGFHQAAAALSEMVLVPVAGSLLRKRLLIVSDGALQYIPFSALPTPQVSTMSNEARSQTPLQYNIGALGVPLIAGHEVICLPSASVLAILRQEARSHPEPVKTVAVLADPVFDINDERLEARPGLREKSHQAQSSSSEDGKVQKVRSVETEPVDSKVRESAWSSASEHLTRSLADVRASGKFYLSRLPYTRREAQAIMAVTPKGQGKEALDFSASRATAMSADLGRFRIVHFATHGLLDSENPELSGLVLSLVDQQGKQQDGFLQLQDIYNLNLPVDLVVLSACETGLGKEIQGEGLVGLTRGFMYAGASRVVASLWKVSDVATAELMERFYKSMEQEKMRPAAALRKAQMQMWQQKRWHDPYYWAGFELQGEWK